MALADTALYVAIHSTLTPQAVTASLNINFLRRPSADKAIVATCKLLKVGRSLVVGEVSLFSQGAEGRGPRGGNVCHPARCTDLPEPDQRHR